MELDNKVEFGGLKLLYGSNEVSNIVHVKSIKSFRKLDLGSNVELDLYEDSKVFDVLNGRECDWDEFPDVSLCVYERYNVFELRYKLALKEYFISIQASVEGSSNKIKSFYMKKFKDSISQGNQGEF